MEPCSLQKIDLFNQNINEEMVKHALRRTYDTVSFSTFPYKVYKESSSKSSLYKYNSGNCIAMAMFVQEFLKNNYSVKSSIIPASVPKMFRVEGTKHLTHVALCIPVTPHICYVVDPAFHFLEPMVCDFNDNQEKAIASYNIHDDMIDYISYQMKNVEDPQMDEDQILQNDSVKIDCVYVDFPDKHWSYYLNEIKNPDESIGERYISLIKHPFITITQYDYENDHPYMVYHIKLDENSKFNVKHKHKVIIDSNLYEVNSDEDQNSYENDNSKALLNDIVFNKYRKYFTNYVV